MAIFNRYVKWPICYIWVGSTVCSTVHQWNFLAPLRWNRWMNLASGSWLKNMCRLLCPLVWQIPEQSYIILYTIVLQLFHLLVYDTFMTTFLATYWNTYHVFFAGHLLWKIQLRMRPDMRSSCSRHVIKELEHWWQNKTPHQTIYIYILIITIHYLSLCI